MNRKIIEELKEEIAICDKQIEAWRYTKEIKEKLLKELEEKKK